MKKMMGTRNRLWLLVLLLVMAVTVALPVTANAASKGRSNKKKVTKVSLNRSSLTLKLKKKETARLKATVKGAKAVVKWKSSNRRVASVSANGKVRAKRAGKTIITARAGGKSAKCKATVKKADPKNVTMYLLQAYSYNAWSGDARENATYTYNAKGLLAECKSDRFFNGKLKTTYSYDSKGNMIRVHSERNMSGYTYVIDYSFTYKNGHKAGCVQKLYTRNNSTGFIFSQYSITWNYFYSGNHLKKLKYEYHNYDPNFQSTINYKYSSSNKRPISVGSVNYKYDSKGNIRATGEIKSCGNKYSNGKLMSRKYKENENTSKGYRYIKVKVPAKMKNKVREQQWALLNDNLNAALEPHD